MSAPAKATFRKAVPIRANLILSRIPLVVPEQTKIEQQYHDYQNQLERRMMWTFPAYHYFKKGTLSEHKFLSVQKKPIIKNPDVWYPKGVPDIQHGRERSKAQEVILPQNEGGEGSNITRPVEKNPIITTADESGDKSSLERRLRNTLYLLVNYKKTGWNFPKFEMKDGASLDTVAENGLRTIGGDNINTWTVSKKPAGVIKSEDGSCDFFIKSHILAGKFNIANDSKNDITEYAWLTKKEIAEKLNKDQFQLTEYLLTK
ncbi:similar to Saccharomyces cerevisiae YNL252C MRPL17 Mitochondrial ribosomal protein of the large subunit [Maudiozyma barnettii]|uniref:Large ribosomal subunit protein mL46 n=1 Tax=Maudiozyma barnettii TaxID=61262 RepID=A0A8H2VEU2_9SACH|nr:mitochondrial 54S ribosomal protein YmL17/YmL30 [Kazachstania barnettii]CAB4253828.1 similar to Saccharomyces cerevisiae YNL252C MRPL17 Mitochondrial ribosomal protein of the large subunit [Kazachstania barnettii]CAD1781577.1 similar to Saccharomyces cerevisiae YNL252C MRPL17 Mitochondrial ribosomal protein of the large subunit [Kazachstania barnettii]